MKSTIFALFLTLSTVLFVSGCVTEVVDETIQKVSIQDAKNFTALNVDRSSEDITVTGWTSDTISVTADLSIWASDAAQARQIADALAFSWSTSSTTAELIVTSDKSDLELARLHELTISAPSRFSLDLETSSGDIRATNMIGDLQINTSSGDVTVDTKGYITATTSDGDVHAVCGRGASLELSSGDVSLDVASTDFDGVNIETSSGDITVRIADSAKVTFDLTTSSGDISVDYSGTSTSTNDGSLRIDVNGGGKIVRIDASSGNIVIQTLR